MENFTIATEMTAKEYAKHYLLETYKKPAFIFAGFIGLYQLTTVTLNYFNVINFYKETPYSEFFVGIFLLFCPALLSLLAVKQFKSNVACSGVISYTFGENGIVAEGSTYKSEYTWAHILRQKESGKFLVLFHTKKSGSFVDKTTMTKDQLEFIKRKVKQK